jgi:hypothetical protein
MSGTIGSNRGRDLATFGRYGAPTRTPSLPSEADLQAGRRSIAPSPGPGPREEDGLRDCGPATAKVELIEG